MVMSARIHHYEIYEYSYLIRDTAARRGVFASTPEDETP